MKKLINIFALLILLVPAKGYELTDTIAVSAMHCYLDSNFWKGCQLKTIFSLLGVCTYYDYIPHSKGNTIFYYYYKEAAGKYVLIPNIIVTMPSGNEYVVMGELYDAKLIVGFLVNRQDKIIGFHYLEITNNDDDDLSDVECCSLLNK